MALAGAAPGGWTEFLAGSKGLQVFAVDPAKLHPAVLALPGVLHLQKSSQVLHFTLPSDCVLYLLSADPMHASTSKVQMFNRQKVQ